MNDREAANQFDGTCRSCRVTVSSQAVGVLKTRSDTLYASPPMVPVSANNMKAKLSAAVVILSCVFSAFTIWIATTNGIGLFGDSVDYVASARQMRAGAGVRTLDGQGGYTPLTQFPPG